MSKIPPVTVFAVLAGLALAACQKDSDATTGNPASDEIMSPAVDTRLNPPPMETVGTPPPAAPPASAPPIDTPSAADGTPPNAQPPSQTSAPPR